MKHFVFGLLFLFSITLCGQDLLSGQAPIDRKMKSVDSTVLRNIIDKSEVETIDSFYRIGKTIVIDNNDGWEWLKDEEGQYIEEFYPLELRYEKYKSHPQYIIIDDDVYDNNGNLIRVSNFVDDGIDFLVNSALRHTYIADYRNNKYNFKKEDANAQNYVKERLGILSSKVYCRYSSVAENYLRQLKADHENDFKVLQKCERLNNLSFKVFFGDLGGKTNSTWKITFSTHKKYKCVFNLSKLPTEQIDWSLYNKSNEVDESGYRLYKVKKGNTLQSIARICNTTVDDLCRINRIGRNVRLTPGQIVKYNPISGDEICRTEGNVNEEVKFIEPDSACEEENKDTIEVDTNKVFDVVEEMPQFPGGPSALFEYISKNQQYPVVAEENGVQGRVICTFVVETDGSVSDIKVVKSVDPCLDKESVRVLSSMPKWFPGKKNGIPVKVKYTVPLTFRLQ